MRNRDSNTRKQMQRTGTQNTKLTDQNGLRKSFRLNHILRRLLLKITLVREESKREREKGREIGYE